MLSTFSRMMYPQIGCDCHWQLHAIFPPKCCLFELVPSYLLVDVDCSVDCISDFAHGLILLRLWVHQRNSLWPCPSYLTFYCTARILLASLITLSFPLVDSKSHKSCHLHQGYSKWRNLHGPWLI